MARGRHPAAAPGICGGRGWGRGRAGGRVERGCGAARGGRPGARVDAWGGRVGERPAGGRARVCPCLGRPGAACGRARGGLAAAQRGRRQPRPHARPHRVDPPIGHWAAGRRAAGGRAAEPSVSCRGARGGGTVVPAPHHATADQGCECAGGSTRGVADVPFVGVLCCRAPPFFFCLFPPCVCVCVCVCDGSEGRLAYDFLDELRKEFLNSHGGQVARASRPYEFIRFGTCATGLRAGRARGGDEGWRRGEGGCFGRV